MPARASVDLLIEDIAADLLERSVEVLQVAGGWMPRIWLGCAPAIRTAADVGDQHLDLREYDVAALAAIAYHQPTTRDGLKDIFGREVNTSELAKLGKLERETVDQYLDILMRLSMVTKLSA